MASKNKAEEYTFVLFSKKTGPSGRALAKHMSSLSKKTIHYGLMESLDKLRRQLGHDPSVVVNIGEANPVSDTKATILNNPSKVGKSSNKRGARIAFRDQKIPAPELWLDAESIPDDAYPIVGRTTNHTKGHGFWYCKNKSEASTAARQGATHFLKFIKNTREFRVHIMATRVGDNRKNSEYASIKLSEKVYDGKHTGNVDIIKNHDNGWTFQFPKEEGRKGLFEELRKLAKKSISLFDMDWGAVDIMYCLDDKKCYVLEINSSPCLTSDTANTIEKYSEWILHLCGLKPKTVQKLVEQEVTSGLKKKLEKLSDKDKGILKRFLKRIKV